MTRHENAAYQRADRPVCRSLSLVLVYYQAGHEDVLLTHLQFNLDTGMGSDGRECTIGTYATGCRGFPMQAVIPITDNQ